MYMNFVQSPQEMGCDVTAPGYRAVMSRLAYISKSSQVHEYLNTCFLIENFRNELINVS